MKFRNFLFAGAFLFAIMLSFAFKDIKPYAAKGTYIDPGNRSCYQGNLNQGGCTVFNTSFPRCTIYDNVHNNNQPAFLDGQGGIGPCYYPLYQSAP